MSEYSEAVDLVTTIPLKPQHIRRVVELIEQVRDDDEAAHALEDMLHVAVLRAIAQFEPENASELAELALKTRDIEFARWCS